MKKAGIEINGRRLIVHSFRFTCVTFMRRELRALDFPVNLCIHYCRVLNGKTAISADRRFERDKDKGRDRTKTGSTKAAE
jgi:hypothetical protein